MKSILAVFLLFTTLAFAETAPQSMEMANECFGIKAKPFSTYQKFYFKADGIAYGLKNGQEVKLKFDDSLKKLNADGTIDYQQSLQNFKNVSGISPLVCKADTTATPVEPGASGPAVPSTPSAPVAPNSCNTLSEMDSVVLAMSWQPAFCEEKGSKPECKLAQFLATDSYQASNFTLHGMWPNKNSCGQNYGFCGEVKSNQSDFCKYPEVNIANQSTEKDLESVMPSRAAGSCLERHEWHKHGTCQTLEAAKYFDRAITLLKDFNKSKVGDLIRKHVSKSDLKKSDLLEALDESFGKGASKQFILICKGANLTEIQVNLTAKSLDPKTLESQLTIKNLLNESASGYIRGCKDKIAIDKIGPN